MSKLRSLFTALDHKLPAPKKITGWIVWTIVLIMIGGQYLPQWIPTQGFWIMALTLSLTLLCVAHVFWRGEQFQKNEFVPVKKQISPSDATGEDLSLMMDLIVDIQCMNTNGELLGLIAQFRLEVRTGLIAEMADE